MRLGGGDQFGRGSKSNMGVNRRTGAYVIREVVEDSNPELHFNREGEPYTVEDTSNGRPPCITATCASP